MIVQGRSSKSSSSRYRKSKSSSSNNNRYAVSKSGMKVAPGSAAYDRVVSNGGAVVTLDNGDGGYVRKNRDGTTTSYNSGYSTGSRRSSGGGGSYRSYLEDARRSAMDAQRARVQSAIDTVAAQQSGIHSAADKNAQQAYIAKEQALTNMPQQLASLGQSGGASESALLGLNTNYENNRNQIFENRDKAIQQNEQQQNQIRASGDASIADIENAYASKLAQFEAEQEQYERQRRDQLNDIQSQRDYDQSVWERNNAYAAKLAAQKAAQGGGISKPSGSSASFSNLMKLYDTTGNPKYLEAAEQSVGIVGQTASDSYSPGIPATVSRTGNYNDAWVQSIIKTYRNMGLSDYEIAQKLNSMGYN